MRAGVLRRLERAERDAPAPVGESGVLVIVDRFFKDNPEEFARGEAWVESTQWDAETRERNDAANRSAVLARFPPLKVEREQSDNAPPVYVLAESLRPTEEPEGGVWRISGDDEAEA